jgi:phosphoglycolate phosphatase
MRSVILFDLDGTLLDTSPGIFETANHTMEQLGFHALPVAQLRKFVGPPLPACFRVACGLEERLIPSACAIYRKRYAAHGGMFKALHYPGMEELLRTLVGMGVTLGVATLKLESLAHEVLGHFGMDSYFATISGADENGTLDKAGIIEVALERLKVESKADVLMVGDTPHDLEGARKAGVGFVGVYWGFGFNRDHRPDDPHVLGMIDAPGQLIRYL